MPVGKKIFDGTWESIGVGELDAYEYDTFIFIYMLNVWSTVRNLGWGRWIMEAVCRYADYTQKFIEIFPTGSFGSDLERLKSFYRSLGFEDEYRSGEGLFMVRKPGIMYALANDGIKKKDREVKRRQRRKRRS